MIKRMTLPTVRLKPNKNVNVTYRHPWIFSGALEEMHKKAPHGAVVRLEDADGKPLAVGTYADGPSIAVRIFEFGDAVLDAAWFSQKIADAQERRELMGYGPGTDTTGYRLVFGEADGLPGFVVDRYEDVFVVQVSTAGAEGLKPLLYEALQEQFSPRAIIERNDLPVRKEERLPEETRLVSGKDPGRVEFLEKGIKCLADPMQGQKTGFYLDQRDTRAAVRRLASGKRVLNICSYSGAAGIAAMAGGAASVENVDVSSSALELCRAQAELNGIAADRFTTVEADVFQFLSDKQEPEYGMVLVDPPAFIKSRGDLENGAKAYHFLNRAAIRLVEDGGIFVSSSCSHFFGEEDLAFVLRRASVQAGIRLDVLQVIRQAPDHPESVYFPESRYLKTFVCRVRRI